MIVRATVRYTVNGAAKANFKDFEDVEDAFDFAERWERSNSQGHYKAHVRITGQGIYTARGDRTGITNFGD